MKKIITCVLALAIMLTIAGCSAASTPTTATIATTATPTTPSPLKIEQLGNTTWVLKSYGNQQGSGSTTMATMTPILKPWKDITLTFNGNLEGFYGSDGLNSYGGPCHITNDYKIAVSAITMTQLGQIGGPAGIDAQIDTYYDLLQKATT
jgi:heat shock protein HslJ